MVAVRLPLGVQGLNVAGGGYGATLGVDCLSSGGIVKYWDRLKSLEVVNMLPR